LRGKIQEEKRRKRRNYRLKNIKGRVLKEEGRYMKENNERQNKLDLQETLSQVSFKDKL
jgi:hypothetical protein